MDEPTVDEHTLLCERCGYVLEGLPGEGSCPECGTPIAGSLPAHRPGSPWQRRASTTALMQTAWRTLTAPRRLASELRVLRDRPFGLFARYILLASLLTGVGVVSGTGFPAFIIYGRGIPSEGEGGAGGIARAILAFPPAAGAGAGLLILLSLIERRGIRFFSRRRGGRITPLIARVIIAHAAVGWPVAAIGAIAGGVVSDFLLVATRPAPGPARAVILGLPLLLALPGFLFFEWFAYVGMRRMKFATRPREDTPGAGTT